MNQSEEPGEFADQEFFEGRHETGFAEAARVALDRAEAVLRGRGIREEDLPTVYDVQLRIGAQGVFSDYHVLISPRP
jgi:hypothetical protein